MPAEIPEQRGSLSAVLHDICKIAGDEVTIGEIVEMFGRRAFGALLFAFAIPCVLPLPPGSSTILGLPLVLLAPQVLIGVRAPWVPGVLTRRTLRCSDLQKGLPRVIKMVEAVEKVSRPRLDWVFGPVGDRLIGLMCTALALALILPIPLGNLAPATAVGLLGLGLFQRDGALVLVGHLAALVSLVLIGIGASAAAVAVRRLLEVIGL